ncbi:hypothetical protein [Saccharothrix deserti]|uniref:hypothetical protein n=1 Tax=Saccharothrix deserti TaxID=2593674 RepID=UPI00131DC5D9|nr:hypothetical protein [Saccharothrix deserti]
MNEHDLKSAMQDVMVASSPPPPMDPRAAVELGRRAQRRRQATWGGAVAGLAVVAIAVGAVLVPNMTGGGGDDVAQVGAQQSASGAPSVTATASPPPSVRPTPTGTDVPSDTSTPWPNGQTDRTATSGPRADKSVAVLNDLVSALPSGLKAEDKTRVGYPDYGPMTRTQSQFADYAGALEVWEYMAYTPVTRAEAAGVGKLWIQVETKGNSRRPGEACAAATAMPYPVDGTCQVVDVDGNQVGVVTGGSEGDLEQAAFHRHADGTLVIVAQSRVYRNSGHQGMAEPPLTSQQLATIAANPEFRLD